MERLLFIIVAVHCCWGALGYWEEECGAFPADGLLMPDNVPLDCGLRHLGLSYGQAILPFNVSDHLYTALNLQVCEGVDYPQVSPWSSSEPVKPRAQGSSAAKQTIYIDAKHGSDTNGDGTIAHPFATVQHTQSVVQGLVGPVVVFLRHGTSNPFCHASIQYAH